MKTKTSTKKVDSAFGFLLNLFNRPKPVRKSNSIKELRGTLTAEDYKQKVKFLIKKDLLLTYDPETVDKGIKDLDVDLKLIQHSSNQVIEQDENLVNPKELEPEREFYEILTDEKAQEVWKVEKRIPRWFNNPHQINTRILIAFMGLLEDNKSVSFFKLESACRSINTFKNNYSQMKSFGERNHAKVFEEAGGRVSLWGPVRTFVKQEFERFSRNT